MASKANIYSKFINSIAPTIWGYKEIKEAIVLQMFSGVRKVRPDSTISRGDMHILLVGDPGVAKSQMLKYVTATAPKARYVSGKGATGAGLTAAVVKDEFLRGWALEAGALVLASGGICCIDEIDKIVGREGGSGPDVSRSGVQRDILPLIEALLVTSTLSLLR